MNFVDQFYLRVKWHKYTLTGRVSRNLNYSTQSKQSLAIRFFNLIICFVIMILDISILLALTILSYYFISWCLIEPYERGFYCDDKSIRNELKANTISSYSLLLITLGLPLPLIIITNMLIEKKESENSESNDKLKSNLLIDGSHAWWDNVIKTSTYIYLDYIFAFFMLTLLLDIIKCLVGRLRPNFIAMCEPNNLEICDDDPHAFISHTKCTANWKYSRNSRMSFPSGHASAAGFFLSFFYCYLNKVYSQNNTSLFNLFRLTVILLIVVFSIFCFISRITDYWHFPTDVAGGFIISVIIFNFTLKKYK